MQRLAWVLLIAVPVLCALAPVAVCQVPVNRANPGFKQPLASQSPIQQANLLSASALRTAQQITTIGKPTPVRRGNFVVPRQAQINSIKKNNASTLAPGCVDSSGHILTTESSENIALDFITKTHDNGILVPGVKLETTTPSYGFPYLVKYNASGGVLWAKSFDGLGIYPMNYADAYQCFELADNSILLVGNLAVPTDFNGRNEVAFWRLDANGNLLWVRTDSSSIWIKDNGGLFVKDMVQDAAGNIYLAGNHNAYDAIVSHTFVLKMDLSGNIIWDKAYDERGDGCYGITMTGNELSMIGTNSYIYIAAAGDYGSTIWCLRINPSTGDTLWSKAWYPDYPGNLTGWKAITSITGRIRQLGNGNILVFGTALDDLGNISPQSVHGIFAEFDPSFNYVRGSMIVSSIKSNYYNTVITGVSDDRVEYSYLKYISSYDADIVYGSILRGQIIKERIIHERNRADAWTSNFLLLDQSPSSYVVFQFFSDPVTNKAGHEMVRLHDSDTSSICTGTDTAASWLEPYQMKPFSWVRINKISSNTFIRTNRVMPSPVDGNLSQTNTCKVASSCESFQIFMDKNNVCAGVPVTFTARKNEGCGAIPYWTIDTVNMQSYKILNDSMLQLTYHDATVARVDGLVFGTCSGFGDYKILTVTPGDKPVALNGNSFLCPDSALILRPQKGFASYVWQDGSTADSFLVQSAGKYYVTATSTCGAPSSDTSVVQKAPFLSFSVGPDLPICSRDPVNLVAPGGYQSYSWKDVNTGVVYNSANVQLYPTSNTTFAASARTNLGCVVKDTLLVTVSVVPPINLGPDSSICSGDSVLLNAGPGFAGYLWSNGAQSPSIYVRQAGTYSVKAQVTGGCSSTDTMKVISVYSTPVVNLGDNSVLCEGTVRTLDAGSGFAQYKWEDGSNLPSQTAATVGVYWVQVTTNNGCVGSDTTAITQIVPIPSIDLGPDASFCSGDSLLLNAGSGFGSYSWSNGAQSPSIYVHQAGSYSVRAEVTDGCYSTDTMKVVRVYSTPLVNLGGNGALCEGSVRTLNAGNGFAQYQWENGSNLPSQSVNATGIYWVQVTDNNGCVGGDTTTITQIIPTPSGFLKADTLICDGYPSKIYAVGQFNSYSWNTGDSGSFMTTRRGGTYTLTVTDSYGCSATSDIVVNTKQCLLGVYFPNAFTPNRDGHNDYYKSDVFGNIAKYHLQIFNRWGQSIFETKDFSKGWDGTFHGQEQPVGGYAWVCHYQFEGSEEIQEKGTMMLFR